MTLGPFLLGIDKSLSSGAWVLQIIFSAYLIYWLLHIYQEIHVWDGGLAQTRIGLKGRKRAVVLFEALTGWRAENPYKLYGESGNVLVIPWTVFAKADQRRLFDTLKSLGLPVI